jgi:Chitobiase/beta-hexosaminidase C-terminal domain/Galactose oxidase, central domain
MTRVVRIGVILWSNFCAIFFFPSKGPFKSVRLFIFHEECKCGFCARGGFAPVSGRIAMTQLGKRILTGLLILLASLCLASLCVSADAQTNEWTWMGGSSVVTPQTALGAAANYGILGTPATGNIPGGREEVVTWVDSTGDLWLFGGAGIDSTGAQGLLNDLWEYDPASMEWTWISGSDKIGQVGVPGALGTPSPGNTPGARTGAVGWIDKSGNLLLFGGDGLDSGDYEGWLNDLWEFNPSTKEWAWIGGASALPVGNSGSQTTPGVYGTLGAYAAGNVPTGRTSAARWTDSSGDLWLFGGDADDQTCGNVHLNDLWEFNTSLQQWRWMGGSVESPCNAPAGVYGTLGTPAPGNIPGARYSAVSWTDVNGNFWLYGGFGQDGSNNGVNASGFTGNMNDLWEFNPSTMEWTWIGGNRILETQPHSIDGTQGLPGVSDDPGPDYMATGWADGFGDLWLFGGNTSDGEGDSNDLWVFDPSINEWGWMTGGAYGDQPGVFGTLGQAASGNSPGSREQAAGWVDANGNFWLFGGYGADADYTSAGRYLLLNDLWEYSPQRVDAPQFNPAGGTYNSSQTVTITGATPGSLSFYTTDGTTPTTASTSFFGSITVSSSQTVKAIAVLGGYATSAAASATYTINTQPPIFTLGASPSTLTINSGSQGSVTLTVTPQNGFSSTVTFGCTGLPGGATCSFNPTTVAPSGGAATTQLTIKAGAQSANQHRDSRPFFPTTVLAVAVCVFGWKKRRRGLQLLVLAAAFSALALVSACGGGGATGGGGGGGGGGTQPVTSTVTVVAASGSIQQSATISLTVN